MSKQVIDYGSATKSEFKSLYSMTLEEWAASVSRTLEEYTHYEAALMNEDTFNWLVGRINNSPREFLKFNPEPFFGIKIFISIRMESRTILFGSEETIKNIQALEPRGVSIGEINS